MKKILLALIAITPAILLVGTIKKDWGNPVMYICVFYSLATTVFFIAQLFGFVLSQTHYSESIEEAKFHVLKAEEEEWANYADH